MLDLNLLPVFEAMLLEQNVTAASAHVGLTQSAMSNALGRLRHYFEDPLFVKTRNKMLPTPRALELAQPLRNALALVRSSTQKSDQFDPASSDRVFRIHMTDVGEIVYLPKLIKRLRDLGTSIQVETSQINSEEIAERLAAGELDFAVGYLPTLGITLAKAKLFREHYVCMTRENFGTNGNGKLTLKKFIEASHVLISSMGSGHQIIERTLDRRGVKRNIALRTPHFLVIPKIIADTDLVVTMPSRAADAMRGMVQVRVHPMPLAIDSFDVSLFWHPRFANDPPIQWFRSLFVDLFQELPLKRKQREY